MSKNVVNPFVASLKAQMSKSFPSLPISSGKNVPGIDVNDRSAWVRGEVPAQIAQVLKDAGFIACAKGYYFTHEGTKMPKFATVAPAKKSAPAPTQKPTVKPEKPEKPAKVYEKLPQEVESQIARMFTRKYPGCLVEIKGTWVYLIGLVFKTNEEYRARAKAEGFHYSPKTQTWCRALTQEELACKAEPEAKPAPAEKAPAQVESAPAQKAYADELADLSQIVINARKGLLTRDEMLEAMKAVCPF